MALKTIILWLILSWRDFLWHLRYMVDKLFMPMIIRLNTKYKNFSGLFSLLDNLKWYVSVCLLSMNLIPIYPYRMALITAISPVQLQITTPIRERQLQATWATKAAAVRKLTLLFVTERGQNLLTHLYFSAEITRKHEINAPFFLSSLDYFAFSESVIFCIDQQLIVRPLLFSLCNRY